MDNERQVIIESQLKKIKEKQKHEKKLFDNRIIYFFIYIMILIFLGIIYFIYIKKEIADNAQSNQIKNDLLQNETRTKFINFENKINLLENKLDNLSTKLKEHINHTNTLINNKDYPNKEFKSQNKSEKNINNNTNISGVELSEVSFKKFDENILQQIKSQQMEFCNHQNKYIKEKFEKHIKLAKVDLLDKKFDMYVYKSEDIVSVAISGSNRWESDDTIKLINALNYYSSLKNITNDNIYILDIGSNIGWYTLFLGKFGYKILSFEPSDVNMYILRKNFCLNQDLNITLIKKGLYTEEKKCDFFISKGNIGDGWVFCDKNSTIPNHLIKSGETYLTKLSNYIDFLSKKNLALIKIDVEGSEGKAIESGIEFIYLFLNLKY